MVINKQDILQAIDAEIEDRADSAEDQAQHDEVAHLQWVRTRVANEEFLTYSDYELLCYIVANKREEDIRSELS